MAPSSRVQARVPVRRARPSRWRGWRKAQNSEPLDQLQYPTAGLSPGEASHDRFPQVNAKGLDFNAFRQRWRYDRCHSFEFGAGTNLPFFCLYRLLPSVLERALNDVSSAPEMSDAPRSHNSWPSS